mmetsp:Transcript_11129/g.17598  ORF Transcript_11129/g.17598 Transcript_11129/m.17598 type:complete len:545 (-) Transcript_11129:119-1753(-)
MRMSWPLVLVMAFLYLLQTRTNTGHVVRSRRVGSLGFIRSYGFSCVPRRLFPPRAEVPSWSRGNGSGMGLMVRFRLKTRVTQGFDGVHGLRLRQEELKSVSSATIRAPLKSKSRLRFRLADTEIPKSIVGSDMNPNLGSGLFYVEGLSAEELCKVTSRCMLAAESYEIYAQGETHDIAAVKLEDKYIEERLRDRVKGRSWSAKPVLCGKRRGDVRNMLKPYIKTIQTLHTVGTVSLRNPQVELCVIEDWRPEGEDAKIKISQVFFGRVLSSPEAANTISFLDRFSLRTRHYIGFTAMEPELAFTMANLAQIVPGSSVLDPFCGSCSLLLAAAALGAESTTGLDIDANVLEGRRSSRQRDSDCDEDGEELSIEENFKELGLKPPRIHVGSAFDESLSIGQGFDAILSDPPYGLMEISTDQIGGRLRQNSDVFDSKPPLRLITLAGSLLRSGGRVVFLWARGHGDETNKNGDDTNGFVDEIGTESNEVWRNFQNLDGNTSGRAETSPLESLQVKEAMEHAELQVVAGIRQKMSSTWSRWLCILEKI